MPEYELGPTTRYMKAEAEIETLIGEMEQIATGHVVGGEDEETLAYCREIAKKAVERHRAS